MPDDEAFLAAIAAHPADDTPRLVYADWLDDRNDPRVEYVRLEVERHRLRPRDKDRRADQTARLEALRPLADPHWLPRIDRVGRHSFFWSRHDCTHVVDGGQVGRPLAEVRYQGNTRTWLPKGITAGDYLYVFAWQERTIALVARMRVAEVLLSQHDYVDRLRGVEGTPVRFGRLLPPAAVARMGWYSGREERRPNLTPDGRLPTFETIGRVLRLTPTTATDLDALLAGRAAPAVGPRTELELDAVLGPPGNGSLWT